MSDDKVKVNVSIRGEARWLSEVELSRADYEEWCERLDEARGGYAREKLADELMDLAGFDPRDVDLTDLEVDDFFAPSVTVVIP